MNGYKIIDLSKVTLSSSSSLSGIYEKISKSTKPICLTGIKIDGEEMKYPFPIYPLIKKDETVFKMVIDPMGVAYTSIAVYDDDTITLE